MKTPRIPVRDILLMAYSRLDGQMRGKTVLQKKVYFLAVELKCVKDWGYRAHYYGPYSADVAEANQELKSLGYVSETTTGWGSDVQGFEKTRYDYRLTPAGNSLAERKSKRYPDFHKKLCSAADRLKRAGDRDYMELSIAAKAYFLLTETGGKATLGEIQQLAGKFNWKLPTAALEKATEFLKELELVDNS